MKRKVLCAAVCILAAVALAGCSGGKKAPNYVAYTSAADEFTVEVPKGFENFEINSRSQDTAIGPVTTTAYQSALNDTLFTLAVTKVDVDAKDVATVLAKGLDGVAGTAEEVIDKGETKLDGQPALTLKYKLKSNDMDLYYSGVFSYIAGRQYQLLFGSTDKAKLDGADAKHFFESFKHVAGGAAPAAGAAGAGKPAAAAGGKYTFGALCDKLIAETKAISGAAYTADMANQTRNGCMAAADAYKASPKAEQAMGTFAKHILTACESKSGQDWLRCYGEQAGAAGQAAAHEMMK